MSGWVLSCVVPHPYGDGGAPPSPCRGGRLFTAGPQRDGVVLAWLKPYHEPYVGTFRFGPLAYSITRGSLACLKSTVYLHRNSEGTCEEERGTLVGAL